MTNMDFDQEGVEAPAMDDGAHLDDFRVAGDDLDQVDPNFLPVGEDGEAMAPEQEPGVMSLQAWNDTWEMAWNVPGMMIPKYAPLGITTEKRPASQAAAQAVYELAQDHFPWMIGEQGGVFGAVLAIGPFALMQLGAMREISAEEKRRRAQAMEAANTNAPPEFKSTRAAPGDDPNAWMDQEAAA